MRSDYSPEMIGYWLAQWDLLVSLAESPRTSVHHLEFGHDDRHGSCRAAPRARGGRPSDGLTWALVKADLEGAASALEIGSLERRVVYARMQGGGSLGQIAVVCRTRKGTVLEAYKRALGLMAAALGWVDDETGGAVGLASVCSAVMEVRDATGEDRRPGE